MQSFNPRLNSEERRTMQRQSTTAERIERQLEAASEALQRADSVTRTLFDASKSLGAIIIACGHLLEAIQEQGKRIEHLEDILQDQLERRRR